MSGDVQPRKRKEKRRRREEDDGGSAATGPSGRSGSMDQMETIHVQKEGGTGGHWCARIIFFALLTALVGVVGLIILEHRGTTDVEAPATTSQWAKIFEGWVDESPSSHGEHAETEVEAKEGGDETESHEGEDEEGDSHEGDHEEEEEEGDHEGEDDEEGDHEEEDDEDEEHGKEDEEEEARGEEGEEEAEDDGGSVEADAEDEAECSQEDVQADEEEDRKALEDKTESEEAADEGYAPQGKDDDDDDGDRHSTEQRNDYNSREKVSSDHEDEGFNEENFDIDDDLDALEELEDEYEEQDAEEPSETLDAELDFSIEGVKPADPDDEIDFNDAISGLNDIDDNSAEPLEEIDGEEPEEINEEVNEEEEEQVEEELEEESTSLVMKFGVGVALLITAHFVLVRRRHNADLNALDILNDGNEVPDLTRRHTLIPPSFAKETDGEEQLSKEQFEELQSTYKKVGSNEKKRTGIEEIFARKTADLEQVLRGQPKESKVKKPEEDDEEELLDDEEYSEYEEEDYENEEELEDEEIEDDDYRDEEEEEEEELEDEEEENEEEEEEVDDIEDIDDTELVEKLDQKYGKLPTPPYTDDEEVDEEGDEEEEGGEEVESDKEKYDDEEAELSEWKHVRVPKRQRARTQDKAKSQATDSKSGSQQSCYYFDETLDNVVVTEDNDYPLYSLKYNYKFLTSDKKIV